MLDGLDRFHPLALQLGDEEALLDRAIERLHELDEGAIAVLPELLAWSDDRSEIAYGTLLGIARDHRLGIITTLNLPTDLMEDLPGRVEGWRYNALVIFTPYGDVHVPQAKLTPQALETTTALGGPGIGVHPYGRLNRVRLDLGGELLLETRFLVCSDLWALGRLDRSALTGDLLVVPANFARGAELHARRLLDGVRASGAARATILCNSFHEDPRGRPPLALAVEEVREAPDPADPASWPDAAALADAFRIYDDDRARTYVEMVELPEREGRIALPRSLAEATFIAADYPITVVL